MVEESMQYISAYDPEIAKVLSLELDRQRNNLELIASEQYRTDAEADTSSVTAFAGDAPRHLPPVKGAMPSEGKA